MKEEVFSSPEEAIMAYQLGEVDIHASIKVKISKEIDGGRGFWNNRLYTRKINI